jgi:uncharacterized membrane protein required for colicin V production
MKIDYIKEEIATYREIVKLIVIIIGALIGSMVSFAIKFLEIKQNYYLIFSISSFITLILFFVILIKVWNKMYEFKFKLKDENE